MALKWALTPPNITSSSVQLVRLPPLAAIGLISFASSGSGSGKARELSWGSCVPPGSCSAVQYGGGPASGGARTHWQGTAAGQIEDSRSGTAQSRVQTSVGPVVIKYLGRAVARPECRNIEAIEARGEAEQSGMERETGSQEWRSQIATVSTVRGT